jgi:hypothetical protein
MWRLGGLGKFYSLQGGHIEKKFVPEGALAN